MTSAMVQQAMRDATPNGQIIAPASAFIGILPPDMWAAEKEFFIAPLDALGLAVGAAVPAEFQADSAHDYVFYYGSARARTADNAAVVLNPPVVCRLALAASNRSFGPLNRDIDADNIFGTAAQPSVWGLPMIVEAEDRIVVTLQLLAGAAINWRGGLMGFRVTRSRR